MSLQIYNRNTGWNIKGVNADRMQKDRGLSPGALQCLGEQERERSSKRRERSVIQEGKQGKREFGKAT